MTAVSPRPARALLAALVAAAAMLTGCLFAPNDSNAARGMELAIQDDSLFVGSSIIHHQALVTKSSASFM